MSDIKRYDTEGYGWIEPSPDGELVMFADHVAECDRRVAEAAQRGSGHVQTVNWEEDSFDAGYQQGQRDMLAKCIAAVEGLTPDETGVVLQRRHALAALRALLTEGSE